MLRTTTQTTIEHHSPRPIVVIAQGTMVPYNKTLELKSNGKKTRAIEQVWFGRTPYLCCAKHNQGLVEAAVVTRLKQRDFEDWEAKNQKHLLRLAWFLDKIRKIAVEKASERVAVLIMSEKGAPLQIYEAKETLGALPKEIIETFWD
jgi:hypothetical protein